MRNENTTADVSCGGFVIKGRSLVLAGLVLLATYVLTGCSDNFRGNYEGYSVKIKENRCPFGRVRKLTIYNKGNNSGNIYAQDLDYDKRFDSITLNQVPKGNPLEKLASLEEAEAAYESVTQEAKEAEKESRR